MTGGSWVSLDRRHAPTAVGRRAQDQGSGGLPGWFEVPYGSTAHTAVRGEAWKKHLPLGVMGDQKTQK
jgi:hypothetical protein